MKGRRRQKIDATYYAAHKEEIRNSKAAYWKAHKEELRELRDAYQKAYKKAHKEEFRKSKAAYWKAHKEELQKYIVIWRTTHKEVCNIYSQSRRAKKAELPRTLTPTQWAHVLNEFNNTCAYCGAGDKTLEQEHFIPLSAGGEYTHNNIIPVCRICNCEKGKKRFWDWYPTARCYDSKREKKIMKFLHYVGEAQQLIMVIPQEEISGG